jgi:hypothetical protein
MSWLKKALGVGAMIFAPVLAPKIAGFMGVSSALGTSLIGAGVGALGARAAGMDPLIGAGVGGLGTFAMGGGFSGAEAAAGGGGLFGSTPPPTPPVPPVPPVAPGVGSGLLGGLSGNVGQALTMMALSSFGKAPQDLTEQERQAMAEQARRQGIEENVFNQAFEQARMTAQRAVPDSEGAFARTQIAAGRQFEEDVRGASSGQRGAARRRAAIGSTLAGAGGTAAEQARADSAAGAAASAIAGLRPPSQSAAEQSLKMYGDLYKRRQDYASELSTGLGTMFGGTA